MNRPAASPTCDPAPEPTTGAHSQGDDTDGREPRPAVSLLFHLGELSATPEAIAAARAAGVQLVEAVLRHLGGDWGDVDDQTRAANHDAVTACGILRSIYSLTGTDDAVVVTTDADRGQTIVALASQCEPGR